MTDIKPFYRQVLEEAFSMNDLSLEDTHPYRVRTAYRIVRESLRLRAAAAEDDLLSELPVSTWNNTEEPRLERTTPPPPAQRNPLTISLPAPTPSLPEPFPILPPEEPSDEWLDNYRRIVLDLRIASSQTRDPHEGRYGLHGLPDNFPYIKDIFMHEAILVEEVLNLTDRFPRSRVNTILTKKYGFQPREAHGISRLAARIAREQNSLDIESWRGLMVRKFEDFIYRARKSMELKSEVMGLRALSSVLGLNKNENSDTLGDFIKVVKNTASARTEPQVFLENDLLELENQKQRMLN